MDIKDIQNLIKFVAKSGASEVKLEMEDIKITIKTGSERTETTYVSGMPMAMNPQQVSLPPVATQPASLGATSESKETSNETQFIQIKSPIIGTFYRKSAPDKPTFVEVGDTVNPKSVVCIIEAMKLFNEIESEVSGTIVKVLVEDGTPVEFGQPLFLVEPI